MRKTTSETAVIPIDRAATWSPDGLAEVLRTGAQRLRAQVVEAEIEAHLARPPLGPLRQPRTAKNYPSRTPAQTRSPDGHRTDPGARPKPGIAPKAAGGPIQFRSLERLLPGLYLKGVSTGAFEEASGAVLGSEALGLSASTTSRKRSLPVVPTPYDYFAPIQLRIDASEAQALQLANL